jgi:hypothetical protein
MKRSFNCVVLFVVTLAILLSDGSQFSKAQTGCGVNCIGLTCWVTTNNTNCNVQANWVAAMIVNGPQGQKSAPLAVQWFNSQTGCSPATCTPTGTSANIWVQQCTGTFTCNPLCSGPGGGVANTGQASGCGTPTGTVQGPFQSYYGCTPLSGGSSFGSSR